ncbi:MAG: PorV/PorQ family protein [Ignavibacteria bacterium]|jgi:hypothetical protein
MKKLHYTLILIFTLSNVAVAQYDLGFEFSKAGSAGLQFLKIGAGARETGMGEAVTGVVKDANAMFWNVSGIAYAEDNQAIFSFNNWLVDSKYMAASVALPFNNFVIGFSAISLSINEFEETTVQNPDGTGRMVNAGDLLIGVGIARRFTDKLAIGGQVKYVHEKLDDYTADNILFDIGASYSTGWRNLRLAFSLQHFGPDMKFVDQTFRTPLLFRLSATDEIINLDDAALTLAFELVHPTDNEEWVNIGTELKLLNHFFLRSGYRLNVDEGKMSFGVGFETPSFSYISTKFDYSFVKSEKVFNDIHRFTVSIGF